MARPIDAERLRGYFLPDHAFTGTLKWKGKTGDEFIATSPLGVTVEALPPKEDAQAASAAAGGGGEGRCAV